MRNTNVFFGSRPTAFIARILSSPCLLSGLFLLTVSPVPLQGNCSAPETPPAAGTTPAYQDGEAAFRIDRLGPDAAQIQCRVHQIEGDISPEGLSLRSTREADAKAALRLVSEYLGRHTGAMIALPQQGMVEVDDSAVVRFVRPNCTEEFRVGLDGIRQDFIISRPPAGPGLLRLELKVQGARVEERGGRMELHFDEGDRVLTYGRLHVEDASGKPLPADMIRVDSERISLRVDDSMATYPLRIDPTFSDANWTGLGGLSGTDASVRAIVVDDTGNVYIGAGALSVVGNVPVRQIAMWDGTRWSDLGEGLPIAVERLLIFENSLYAAGQQTGMPGHQVVKREGSVWVPVGGVFNGRIEALKPHLGSLHAAGRFGTIDGVAVSPVARWDGTTWRTVGTGLFGLAFDILSFDGDLIAGGAINTTGAVTSTGVARWNGTSWSNMGSGLRGDVNSLVNFNGNLVAGGSFNESGGNQALRVAMWNGSSWGGIGGMSENFVSVTSLAVSGNTLYAAGNFTQVSGQPASGLAQLNQTWSAVGTGFIGPATVVAAFGSNLYVGGGRVEEDGFYSSGFSWWDGIRWGSLGDTPVGIGGTILAMAWYDDALHVGGTFKTAGGKEVNHVARWEGSEWHALGGGVSNFGSASVRSMAVFEGDLYFAGDFNRAGEVDARNLARWNGESWSALKGGTVNTVHSMITFNDKLVIGGGLIRVDDLFVQNLIQWDGQDFVQTPGFGTGGTVRALTLHDGELYVGGSFFSPHNNIARWNGSSFSAVGTGTNSEVTSMVSSNGTLFAGGRFSFAGDEPAGSVAEWNGSEWKAMGTGVNMNVFAMTEFGGHVLVGGERASSPTRPFGHLLSWNGTEWSEPGSGVNNQVNALLPAGDVLYVGGRFSLAGGRVAAALATLGLQVAPPPRALGIEVTENSVLLRFSGTPGASYRIVRSPDLVTAENWLPITPTLLIANEAGEFEYTDSSPLPGTGFYRAQEAE